MTSETARVSLEVYDPTGILETTQSHASRLDSLEGKTICELSDSIWEDYRTFPVIRELLKKKYPGLKIIPYTEFPTLIDVDARVLTELVRSKGCDGAIIGNAA